MTEVIGAVLVALAAIGMGLVMTWVVILVNTLWPFRDHWDQ